MFANGDSFSHFEWALKQRNSAAEVERFLEAVVATIKRRRKILRKGARLYRAQRGYILKNEEEIGTEIPDAFMPERMRPLPDKASEGRVNRKDKPCLYLAEHKDTAMAEVRPWIGAYITLAVFEVVRNCALVDCSEDKLTTLDLLMREKESTAEELEQAIWGDIAKAFSTPLTRDDTLEEYWPTQCLAERLKAVGYDGVAYQSALGKGRNFALFDLDAAHPINGTLFKTDAVEYKFEQTNNTYYIPKYYPDWAKKSGIDPESEVPYSMRIAAYLPLDAKDAKDDDVTTEGEAARGDAGKTPENNS
jgi:RES domain